MSEPAVSPAADAAETLTPEQRRRTLRRLDAQGHAWMLGGSIAILVLAAVLSVPGTAREDKVLLPIVQQPLPPLCMSKIMFNAECPGCGLTRCFISLAHGDLPRAWAFNPGGVFFFAVVAAQIPYRTWQLSRLARGEDSYRDPRLLWLAYALMIALSVPWVVSFFVER